jgi:hypothetical protein
MGTKPGCGPWLPEGMFSIWVKIERQEMKNYLYVGILKPEFRLWNSAMEQPHGFLLSQTCVKYFGQSSNGTCT